MFKEFWINGFSRKDIQWIISDNGVPVDKLDVKGLDVKKVHSQKHSKNVWVQF